MGRRKSQPGIMADVGGTVGSTFKIMNNSSGLVSDTLEFAREAMKPIMVEARLETAETVIDGVKQLVDLGMSQDDAKEYLVYGRLSA